MGSRRAKKNVKEKVKIAIVELAQAGLRRVGIAKRFNLSKSVIPKILKKSKETTVTVVKKQEQKPKLNGTAVRILQRIVLPSNKKPLYVSNAKLREHYGYKICVRAMRKYVYQCGIQNYVAVSKPFYVHVT